MFFFIWSYIFLPCILYYLQVGNHIDVATGKWTALDAGVGGGIDSYFEYLVKGSIMLNNPQLLEMFKGKCVSKDN